MIELAPDWKRSLSLTSPLLAPATDADAPVGATLTAPLTAHSRGGGAWPRVIEIPGGMLMKTGGANPGLESVLRERQRAWSHSRSPVVVVFAAQGARDWPAMAARLETIAGVGGLELYVNPSFDAVGAIRATRAATDLPILVKLDLDHAATLAADCIAAGANALVVGRGPRGAAIDDERRDAKSKWASRPGVEGGAAAGRVWYGRVYGPAAKPIVMRAVVQVAALKLRAPIVASGGIESADDVRQFLAAGACAAEIDSACWTDPGAAARIAGDLELDA